ncbi:GDSL-type esterase/lipase family protein [Opitutales bacterium]|nr:GDSL-type esterase/lipase family protein [Opitutales bacterium]
MKSPTFHLTSLFLFFSFVFSSAFVQADHHGKVSTPLLHTGDRVALVGGGLIERARLNGYLESALTLGAGPKVSGLRFRNLGWSGDTVFNDARSYFGKPKEGRERLKKIIAEWKPRVVLLNYGAEVALSSGRAWTDESTASKRSAGSWDESVAVFLEGYGKMLEEIRKEAGDDLREIVVVAPPPFENLGSPLPDHLENNRRLAKLRDALQTFTKKRNVHFVDLFRAMGGDKPEKEASTKAFTHDGLHFTKHGYRELASQFALGLGYEAIQPDTRTENLREGIIEKNRLFFHRWRPANETYLYLFRKHEQGNNAKEIPQFDPIIEEREKEIEAIRSQLLKGSQG